MGQTQSYNPVTATTTDNNNNILHSNNSNSPYSQSHHQYTIPNTDDTLLNTNHASKNNNIQSTLTTANNDNSTVSSILTPTTTDTTSTTQPTTSVTKQSSPLQLHQLLQNPVFAGGAGVAGLAAAAGLSRQLLLSSIRILQRYYTISLEVASKDRSYHWLLPYIHTKTNNAQHIAVETVQLTNNNTQQQNNNDNTTLPTFKYVPALGQHYFYYNKHIIQINRKREQSMLDLQTGLPYETLELKTIGRNKNIFTQLLSEARDIAIKQQYNKTIIYTPMGLQWQQFGQSRQSRTLNSVVLDEGISDKLHNDIYEFSQSKQWYFDRGIPYRRGYLLYGRM